MGLPHKRQSFLWKNSIFLPDIHAACKRIRFDTVAARADSNQCAYVPRSGPELLFVFP